MVLPRSPLRDRGQAIDPRRVGLGVGARRRAGFEAGSNIGVRRTVHGGLGGRTTTSIGMCPPSALRVTSGHEALQSGVPFAESRAHRVGLGRLLLLSLALAMLVDTMPRPCSCLLGLRVSMCARVCTCFMTCL